jgi:heme O synthase-like polyprenyltransferase
LGLSIFALTLGALIILFSLRVYYRTGPKADRCAKQLFGFSILYLFYYSPRSQASGFGNFAIGHAMVMP